MRHSLWLGLALVVTMQSAAYALDVNVCGQEIPPGATGTLVSDLRCATGVGVGVLLNRDATLQLNGHSITGGDISVYIPGGRNLAIEGPGELAGAGGVAAPDSGRPTGAGGTAGTGGSSSNGTGGTMMPPPANGWGTPVAGGPTGMGTAATVTINPNPDRSWSQ